MSEEINHPKKRKSPLVLISSINTGVGRSPNVANEASDGEPFGEKEAELYAKGIRAKLSHLRDSNRSNKILSVVAAHEGKSRMYQLRICLRQIQVQEQDPMRDKSEDMYDPDDMYAIADEYLNILDHGLSAR